MAGSFIPFEGGLENLIAGLHKQLEAVATTPSAGNQSIINGAQSVLNGALAIESIHGQYVWPTAPWTGTTIYGLVTFDNIGHPVVVCGLQPDGLYGLGVYDAAGRRSVLLGQQPSTGDYGLSVQNQSGVLQRVGGTLMAQGADVASVTSSSFAATTAAITCNLGVSGQALVTWNCTVEPNAGGNEGDLALYVDGSFYSGALSRAGTNTASTTGGSWSIAGSALVTKTAGSHTFVLRVAYTGTGGGSATFEGPTIFVQPL